LAVLLAACYAGAGVSAAEPPGWPFFAFDNGVGRGTEITPEQQAVLLADLGYQGIGYTGVERIPEMLQALEARDLKMFSTYVPVNLDPGVAAYDPRLPQAIRQLKGKGTAIWVHVHGKAASPGGLDERAVSVLRELAGMAKASGLPVVLYPHTGFYVATCQDAVRIAEQVDRENVGVAFNLCHFLKQHDPSELQQTIRQALPQLMLVSINGADSGNTKAMGWDRLIQTLDRGTFPVESLLQLLADGGYQGPIGLQCYAIPGDFRDNLRRSMKAWRALTHDRQQEPADRHHPKNE
jgi:sugar phosphate isomerase/epimerase